MPPTTRSTPARRTPPDATTTGWGGRDHFAADRASGEEIARAFPTVRTAAVENRRFLQRATRFLTAEAGIRQFLDIGTGLTTADNTHEVAQAVAPESRVVYVDHDLMVMVHARALLTSSAGAAPRTWRPTCASRSGSSTIPSCAPRCTWPGRSGRCWWRCCTSSGGPRAAAVVRTLPDALPSGSYLVASNSTKDFSPPEVAAAYDAMLAAGRTDAWPRDRAEFSEFFAGLELVDPGVVAVSDWRAEGEPERGRPPAEVAMYGAVGRKP